MTDRQRKVVKVSSKGCNDWAMVVSYCRQRSYWIPGAYAPAVSEQHTFLFNPIEK